MTIRRSTTGAPTGAAFLLALLALLLFPAPLCADTSFEAGDGTWFVYGRTLMTCQDVPNDAGVLENVPCVLVGTIGGKPIAAVAPAYAPKGSVRENRLYMVTIQSAGNIYFSGVEGNVVEVKLNGGRLQDWMTYIGGSGASSEYLARFLEIPDPQDSSKSLLLASNGSSTLRILRVDQITSDAFPIRWLKATESAAWQATGNLINVDRIDLESYRVVSRDVPKPPAPSAIVLWYQRPGMTMRNNWTWQANSVAVAKMQNASSLSVYQTFENVYPFNSADGDLPSVWDMAGPSKQYWALSVVGGALVNPDETGKLHYWFSMHHLNIFKDLNRQLFSYTVESYKYLQTYALEITVDDQGTLKLVSPSSAKGVRSEWAWYYWTDDFGRASDQIDAYTRDWAGPRIRTDAAGQIWIDSYTPNPPHDADPHWATSSKVVGKISFEPDPEGWKPGVAKSRYEGIPDSQLTPEQKAEKALVEPGTQVVAVLYGWPHFGTPETYHQDGLPLLTRQNVDQTLNWKSNSNGFGFDGKLGFKAAGWSVSAIAGVSYNHTTETEEETTKTETLTVKYGLDHYDQDEFQKFQQTGAVFYTQAQPQLSGYGHVVPASLDPAHKGPWVNGMPDDVFTFDVLTFRVGSDAGMNYAGFNVNSPGTDLAGRLMFLSKGLAPRPITLVTPDKDGKVNEWADIHAWQEKVGLHAFLTAANSKTTAAAAGLSIFTATTYDLQENKGTSFERTKTTTRRDDTAWYAGIEYKHSPETVGVKSEATSKYTGSYSQSDSKSSGLAWSLAMPKSGEAFVPSCKFMTHIVSIDMRKFSTWIYSSPSSPWKGKPDFVPDWNWTYLQDFTLIASTTADWDLPTECRAAFEIQTDRGGTSTVRIAARWTNGQTPRLSAHEQRPVPSDRPGNLRFPAGVVSLSFDSVGVCKEMSFIIELDASLPVNGFWVRARDGGWVDVAQEITVVDGVRAIVVGLKDGSVHDQDAVCDGKVTVLGGPGWMAKPGPGGELGFDLDFDGKADLVLEDGDQKRIQVDLVTDAGHYVAATAGYLADGWHIQRVGQWGGFGALVARQQTDPSLVLALMEGAEIAQGVDAGDLPVEWQLLHAADFDGDGAWDLLLRSFATGRFKVIYLDASGQVLRSQLLEGFGAWDVVHFPADLDGDGRAELVVEDVSTAGVRMVRITDHGAEATPMFELPAGWSLEARGFFDRDARADLILRKKKTGEAWLLLMNGPVVEKRIDLVGFPAGPGGVVLTADFNGDGLSDLLWMDEATRMLSVILMEPEKVGATGILHVLPHDWRVVAH